MSYAPIALFTYNRADKTKAVIESLLQNAESKDSDLFIFSDGPKNEKAVEGVRRNREYIDQVQKSSREFKWFKNITIIEREKNWGLSNSLIAGITELCNKYGKVIVVEDDLIVSRFFLKYMNEALAWYRDDERVSAVSAFLTPTNTLPQKQFFLRYFDCWGWATWKRGWDLLNTDTKELLKLMRWKKKEFDMGHVGGFYGTLYCQKIGLVDSWAVRFYASSFLSNKLVLFPTKTMTIQNGIDGSGVHCGTTDSLYKKMELSQEPQILSDIQVIESQKMYNAYHHAFMRGKKTFTLKDRYNHFKSFVRRFLGVDHR